MDSTFTERFTDSILNNLNDYPAEIEAINNHNTTFSTTNQIAYLYLIKGWLFNKLQELDSSLINYNKAIHYYQISSNNQKIGYVYLKIGLTQLVNGQYENSLLSTQNSIKYFQLAQDEEQLVTAKIQISSIYHDIGEYQLGIKYGISALEDTRELDLPDRSLEAKALNAIAICYDDSGNYDKAIFYHKKVLDLKSKLADTNEIASTYNNMGNSLLKKGELNEAFKFFQKNLVISHKLNNKYELATVYTNLATVEYKKGNYSSSKNYLDIANKYAQEIQDVEKIQDVLYQYFELFNSSNQKSLAIDYLQQFYQFKDSLQNEEKIKALHSLEVKYQTKENELLINQQSVQLKNQKQLILQKIIINIGLGSILVLIIILILLFRNRNKKKKLVAEQLQSLKTKELQLKTILSTQEKERERFSTDLHDSFGQTLTVLKMNIDSLQNGNKANTSLLFKESREMLSKIYDELQSVCFNLMPKTLIRNGLLSALEELIYRFNISAKINIQFFHYDLHQRLDSEVEKAIYRIVQEWINNIIKYSNSKNVTVQLTTDGKEVTLTIENDGYGFDSSILLNSTGNGWNNINARVNFLQGQIDLDTNKHRQNTILTINFDRTEF